MCRSAIRPGERVEVCNGEDDNCDGRVDEGFDKDGDGYTTCGGDCDDRNPSVHPDAVERCNGRDDNCNGLADEGFNVGGICTVGEGNCLREGRRRCSPDGLSAECDVKPGPPSKEVCDGRDNDCDGVIDNGLGEISCGVGACRRTVPTCSAGGEASCVPGEPGVELCGDGIDNDCDGEVDEGFSDVGRICYEGTGACRRAGRIVCDETKLATACDAAPGEPAVEICGNRIDDDCDGETDSDTPGLGDPCTNGMPGDCHREGRLVCDARENRLVCSAPEGKPGPERCDGRDNDCDGAIDNGVLERAPCGQGVCAGGTMERRCSAGLWGDWSECSTAARTSQEICGNGIDDDCDGIVDADAPGLGDPCENEQQGVCSRKGKFVCAGPDGSLICSSPKVEPSEEICNGIDDDCDGAIDEGVQNACGGCGELPGVEGGPCTISGGDECALGRWACSDKGMLCSLDNSISDGMPCGNDGNPCTLDLCRMGRCEHVPIPDGTPCDDGDPCTVSDICEAGACRGGASLSCDDGGPCTTGSCDLMMGCVYRPVGEGRKNECGGCEALASTPGEECSIEGKTGVCSVGRFTCLPDGTLGCVQSMFAVKEECNGIDDNCNGEKDEGLGESSCGIGACHVTVANCSEGKPQSCVPKDPEPESCANMGVDDDCNGVADDVAGLGGECPASIGTCIMPGIMRCVGDATSPVCVPVDASYAEDDDGDGIVNYCDHGAAFAGGSDEVGEHISMAPKESGGYRLYDAARTRALMLPWSLAFDSAVIAPESQDQAMLIISGQAGADGGLAALRAKDLSAPGAAIFRSCMLPASEAPRKLLVVGAVADVIASTPKGYSLYPKIASQIPSPLAGNYRCRLRGEPIAENAKRFFVSKAGIHECDLHRVEAIELLSERPIAFVGAAVCKLPASSFWESEAAGLGLDVIAQDDAGKFTYEFVPLAFGEGAIGEVKIAQLSKRYGGGIFVAASIGKKQEGGICRRTDDGWRCRHRELFELQAPVAFAGYASGRKDGPLIVIASDGAAFEVTLAPDGDAVELLPAGGVAKGSEGAIVEAIPFPEQSDRPPVVILGRENSLSAVALRFSPETPGPGVSAASGVVRALQGESILPEAPADDVFPGGRLVLGSPHAMAIVPLKGFGGRDLFVAYRIMSGQKQIGEMGFFYSNANDKPAGALSDVAFDGRRGSAKLSFVDPTGDLLSYRATIKARHGGSLDDWVDGFEGGRVSFSVKGDAFGVGIWPIEITVEATDPGGLSAVSRVVMRRDGTVEAISESSGAP